MIVKFIRKFLPKIVKRLPLRAIKVDNEPYLDRYYLFGGDCKYFPNPRPLLSFLPFTVFVHNFKSGDKDRNLHNHPWKWAFSWMLAGGYREEYRDTSPDGKFIIKCRYVEPGSFNKFHANHFHRVDLLEKDAWSLFIVGTKQQSWGFWDIETNEFLNWKDYMIKNNEYSPELEYAE